MPCGQPCWTMTRCCAPRLRRTTVFQPHRLRCGCRVRVAALGRRCCSRGAAGAGVPVRMGIATGEAELRDGVYFGKVLNRAARVMAAGHGGQILVADSTAVLLGGIDLVDLEPRRLRDLPIPRGAFQIRAPGLRTDFAPLRALDTSPKNLRPALLRVKTRVRVSGFSISH